MKKSYFLMAVAATMFAACSQSDVLNETKAQDEAQAIGFSTYANKATRAENNTSDYIWQLGDHHLSFDVFAGKKVGDETKAVYTDAARGTANGTYTGAGWKWTASPLKYWDKAAAEYYFYAGAPSDANWKFAMTETDNYAKGYLKYEYFTLTGANLADGTATVHNSWKDKADVDLMIAAPKTVDRAFYHVASSATPNHVELQFNHILSRLNIKVQKGANIAADHALVLKSLTVYGLNNKGSFDENLAVADGTAKIARWKDQSVDGTYELAAALPSSAITSAVYTHEYLIIPQAVAAKTIDVNGTTADMSDSPYFKIVYTIADEEYVAYYNLAAAFSAATSFNFSEGWQNTLTVTINPNAIVFDATASEWSTALDREHSVK